MVTLGWFEGHKISLQERRPLCGRLGMGSAISSLDADLPRYYTHIPRLCKVESEATSPPPAHGRDDKGGVRRRHIQKGFTTEWQPAGGGFIVPETSFCFYAESITCVKFLERHGDTQREYLSEGRAGIATFLD
jgi:hypothetical protein